MTFSFKTLIIAAILFICSMLIVGSMHLPLANGQNGFEAMEETFNSLRKGVKPPFKKLDAENSRNLGKNIRATLTFRDNEKARTATLMFLRNKLMVTPKGRTVNIQGDLGYTLKFFMEDIHLLYMHDFSKLKQRYSMSPTQSMYMLDRILKKLAVAMASQRMLEQEKLINKIRQKLLIPAYNLRQALPVSETSGFLYLAIGTIGILLFAILWDIANYLFFGTLESKDFMKTVRIALGKELSDSEKAANLKKEKHKKKIQAAKAKKKKQSKLTNKETLQEVKVKTETSKPKKKVKPQVEDSPEQKKKIRTDSQIKPETTKKKSIKKTPPGTDKTEEEVKKAVKSKSKTAPAPSLDKKRKMPLTEEEKKALIKKRKIAAAKKTDTEKVEKTAPPKKKRADSTDSNAELQNTKSNTSQKVRKKVTTHHETKNKPEKIDAERTKNVTKKASKPQTPKQKSVRVKITDKPQDKT